MKQIKTILAPINNTIQYDNAINSLLANGWELKKRKIITTQGELSEAFNAPMVRFLYAELERYKPPFPEEITI